LVIDGSVRVDSYLDARTPQSRQEHCVEGLGHPAACPLDGRRARWHDVGSGRSCAWVRKTGSRKICDTPVARKGILQLIAAPPPTSRPRRSVTGDQISRSNPRSALRARSGVLGEGLRGRITSAISRSRADGDVRAAGELPPLIRVRRCSGWVAVRHLAVCEREGRWPCFKSSESNGLTRVDVESLSNIRPERLRRSRRLRHIAYLGLSSSAPISSR
jgi:hypothetical protein